MLSSVESKIVASIAERRDALVHLLEELIRFKTITPPLREAQADFDRQPHGRYQDFLREKLRGLGFEIDTWEVAPADLQDGLGFGIIRDRDLSGMPVVVGKRQGIGGGKSLILNGHYDVVDPGDYASWSSDPFVPVAGDGKLYGRGACDMKGGIAAMIAAVEVILRGRVRLKGDLLVESVPDEEGSLMGTLSCCQKGYRADAAIIPEPTNFNTMVAMRGYLAGKITIPGRAGHAEMTHPHWTQGGAVNAIAKAAKVLQAMEELNAEWRIRPDTRHKLLDPNHIEPTVIRGGRWAISFPDKVEIEFTSNFIPKTEYIQQEIAEKLAAVAATDSWLKQNPPSLECAWAYGAEISETDPIALLLMEAARDQGVASVPSGFGSLTDAVHLINYAKVPTVSIGPSIQTAHAVNEFIEIGDLLTLAQILALAILRWCKFEEY